MPAQPAKASPDWWDDDWQHRIKFTIAASDVGSELTDFPVLVHLSDSCGKDNSDLSWLFDDKTQDNGEDIRLTDANDVLLDHEIEEWDNSGEAWIWVRIPTISSDSDTEFYMYYGNPTASDGQNPADVWDDNFKMVQHLNETSKTGGPYNDHLDSTQYGNHGEARMSPPTHMDATGKIGGADDFDGTNDYVGISDKSSLDFSSATGLTIEAWVYVYDWENWRDLVFKGDETRDNTDFQFALVTGTHDLAWDGTFEGDWRTEYFDTDRDTEEWIYLVLTHDISDVKCYRAGLEIGSTSDEGAIYHSSEILAIGRAGSNNGGYIEAKIDEARISDTARSADWIKAQYLSMSDDFITYTNQLPFAPTGLGPTEYVDGSLGSNNTPTLTFTQSDPDGTDTVSYTIQIDDDDDFLSAAVDYTSGLLAQGEASFTVGQAEGAGTYDVYSATLPDGDYYWRVMSTDNNGATSDWALANGGDVAFRLNTATEAGHTLKDRYHTYQDVEVSGSGFMPGSDVNVYVVEEGKWLGGETIADYGIVAMETFTADGDGEIGGIIWYAPLAIGEYDVVFDANQNGDYDEITDSVDDPNHPGFTVVGSTVGGEVYPIDKAAILLPWLSLSVALVLAAGGLILVRRAGRPLAARTELLDW